MTEDVFVLQNFKNLHVVKSEANIVSSSTSWQKNKNKNKKNHLENVAQIKCIKN